MRFILEIVGALLMIGGVLYTVFQSNQQVMGGQGEILRAITTLGEQQAVTDANWLESDDADHSTLETVGRDILDHVDNVLRELATQSIQLSDIIDSRAAHFSQREQRFEELENENKILMQMLADTQYRLGEHQERLLRVLSSFENQNFCTP